MSRYLIDRISVLSNVEIHVGTDLTELAPNGGTLASATVRDCASGTSTHYDIGHLFLFIDATPHTRWLNDSVQTDDKGLADRPHRSRPACLAFLQSATSALARPSESPLQSATEPLPSPKSTVTSAD
ncbi:hypothetical protein [Cupriavidus lacunae]|uniref:hypothetical protein n=1 Tax=Cupriavidus lacunae TaxID=2666307 RepID=UPI001FC9DCFF|nr:hypothetical protein [Cupriavidus lacunae]